MGDVKPRSTEYGGLGQSGYTAGRRLPDPALEREMETQSAPLRRNDPEDSLVGEIATDERWTGKRSADRSDLRTGAATGTSERYK